MHGARLAVEPATELLENGVRPVQDPAEARNRVAVPGGVVHILRERRCHRDAERLLGDLNIDAELAEQGVEAGIEVRDRQPVAELERLGATVGRLDDDGVIDEVDRDLERRAAVMQLPRGEPSDIDIQRDVHQWLRGAVVASRILPTIWL